MSALLFVYSDVDLSSCVSAKSPPLKVEGIRFVTNYHSEFDSVSSSGESFSRSESGRKRAHTAQNHIDSQRNKLVLRSAFVKNNPNVLNRPLLPPSTSPPPRTALLLLSCDDNATSTSGGSCDTILLITAPQPASSPLSNTARLAHSSARSRGLVCSLRSGFSAPNVIANVETDQISPCPTS